MLLLAGPAYSPARLLQTPVRRREFDAADLALHRVAISRVNDGAKRLQLERRLGRACSIDDWVQEVMAALRRQGSCPLPSVHEVRWALGVAYINGHGATEPTRGVLGLLSSMMQHDCDPTCSVEFAPMSEGSTVSLRTLRQVQAGELLSISYVEMEWSTAERRAALDLQYGFFCRCSRCCADDACAATTSSDDTGLPEGTKPSVWGIAEFEPFLPKLKAGVFGHKSAPVVSAEHL